ncbi:unnamed protein product [Rotaria magnacalcarata]|nr:unnamed protein product [Rotaria magnacalcarata]
MWQWRQSQSNEWQNYSDIETAIIEDVYNRHGNCVELEDNVVVDLKQGLQMNNANKKKNEKAVEIRRLSTDCDDAETFRNRRQRNDRFCSAPQMEQNTNANSSLGAANWNGSQCPNLESLSYGDIMRQALEGIRQEGREIGLEKQAQWIVDHFMPVTKESFENICRACLRLYTMEGKGEKGDL